MTRIIQVSFVTLALGWAVAACSADTDAQSGGTPVPFKVGTFERGGQPFVGLVLRDTQVVDIAQGNAAFEASNASAPKLTPPADMKQLIAGYESGWNGRLAAPRRPRLPRLPRWVSGSASQATRGTTPTCSRNRPRSSPVRATRS